MPEKPLPFFDEHRILSVDENGKCHLNNCDYERHDGKNTWCFRGWAQLDGTPTFQCPLFGKKSSHAGVRIEFFAGEIEENKNGL